MPRHPAAIPARRPGPMTRAGFRAPVGYLPIRLVASPRKRPPARQRATLANTHPRDGLGRPRMPPSWKGGGMALPA